MPPVAKVAVDLETNSAKFTSGLTRADAALAASGRKWTRELSAIDAKFAALGKGIGVVIGALSVQQFAVMARQALDAAGGLGEMATQLGISASALQVYQYAATQAGMTTEEFATGLARLTRTIGDTVEGDKKAIDTFNRLGIGVLDAGGNVRSTEAIFRDVAQAMTGIDDPSRRAAVAVDLFGKSGQKLLPVLEGGAAGLSEFERQAKAAGMVLSDDMIAQADEAADKLAALEFSMTKLGQAAAASFAPGISEAADAIERLLRAAGRSETIDELTAKLDRLRKERASLESEGLISSVFRSDLRSLMAGDPKQTRRSELNRQISGVESQMPVTTGADLSAVVPISRPDTSTSNPQSSASIDAGKKAAETINKQVAALQFQEAQLGRTAREQAIYGAVQQAGAQATTAQRDAIAAAAGSLYDKTEAVERLNAVEDAYLENQFSQAEARNAIASGMEQEISDNAKLLAALQVSEAEYERVAAMLELINQYRAAGLQMSAEEIAAAEQTAKKLGEQRVQMDGLKDKIESTKKLGADLGMTFSSAFEDAIVSAKSFSDVLRSLGEDILRLMIRSQITQPLAAAAQPFFSGLLGSIGGFLGFAGGTSSAPPGMAWVGERGPELINFKGGEQVYPAMLSKQIASAYSGLPGYADGAFSMVDGGPVGGGDIKVNIINNAGDEVTAQRRMSSGGPELDVMIDQAVSKKLGQRGGQSNKAMRQTFGAREQLVTR